jgi:hypothetical protein
MLYGLCGSGTPAEKQYQKSVMWQMAAYVLIVFGVTHFVRGHGPKGYELYFLAALPSLPIVGVLISVGVYLRNETDEYQRDLMVRSMLWGIAGVLMVATFFGFMRSFGWNGSLPPFTEFVLFWILVGASKAFYLWKNRPGKDDLQ